MKFSTAIAAVTVLVVAAPSVVVALPAGCWKNGQNRPTADGHAIALHMCQALASKFISSPFSKNPVFEESKGITYCINYPPEAPVYHWDLTLTSFWATPVLLTAEVINECYNTISNTVDNCSNSGGTKTHGGKGSGPAFAGLVWNFDPGNGLGSCGL